MSTNQPVNEIHITRVYDAPVKAVWDAWTEPAQAAKWWGPRGFSITTHSKDLKPGGVWHYTMHGPDGTDYPNKAFYIEVVEHQKLVYDHGGYDDRPPLFRVTVLFSESDGKTIMEMSMQVSTPEELAAIKKIIKDASGNSTWDRLAEYLDDQRECRNIFVLNRSFDAPIERVFDAWTSPEVLTQWLPPTGFEMEFQSGSIVPNGEARFMMTNNADVTMFGRINYVKIEKPSQIVYTQQFCDENGVLARHPAVPTWPDTMLTKVEFASEGANTTRVTITSQPFGDVTSDEIKVFTESRGSMTFGWTGSFDKLEGLLDKASRNA